MLKSVIHDWDDTRCTTILGHARQAIPDDGRLLIIEPVLPTTLDGTMPLNMLVNAGGCERNHDEYRQLCAAARFRLDSVTPLPPGPFSLLEASPLM